MIRAIELSIKSVNTGTGPFGSVIVKDNRIISEGFNTVTLIIKYISHSIFITVRTDDLLKLYHF